MDKLPISARIIISICFIIACLMGTISLLGVAVTAVDVGAELPLRYFEQLNFPTLTVLFPIIGMVVIGAIALVLWSRETKSTALVRLDDVAPAEIVGKPESTDVYPKAA